MMMMAGEEKMFRKLKIFRGKYFLIGVNKFTMCLSFSFATSKSFKEMSLLTSKFAAVSIRQNSFVGLGKLQCIQKRTPHFTSVKEALKNSFRFQTVLDSRIFLK